MKFLSNKRIVSINQLLAAQASLDNHVTSRLECFQVEPEDYQTFRTNSYERPPFQSSYGASPDLFLNNPMYSLNAFSSSHHFPALKASIEHTFSDYDFSNITPWNFRLISSPEQARQNLSWSVSNYFNNGQDLTQQLWQAIDGEIQTVNSEIYEYQSDCPDAFSEMGTVFNLIYFFINEKINHVLVFHLREGSNEYESGSEDEDVEVRFGYSYF